MKKGKDIMQKKPDYLSYFEFKKEQDYKQLAKKILDGTYDFASEDKKIS